jgi:hypothetical protein
MEKIRGGRMKKIDLKKQLAAYYKASAARVADADVPSFDFLMIDGRGDPNRAPEYAEAVTALYQLSYAIKFHLKKGKAGIDYGVMPLEGLWWVDDMHLFTTADKSAWKWTMMILQPEFVTREIVAAMRAEVAEKKSPPALSRIRFETFREGSCAQILYVGPYADEGPAIQRIHDHIRESGHSLRGKHHEIYLKDPRKCAPEKLQTIIRQPYG